MAEISTVNTADNRNHSKKKIIAAVTAALIILAAVFLAVKNPVFFMLSQKQAADGKLDTAEGLLAMCSNGEAELMRDYIDLRQDINGNYALMISAFDKEKINQWQKSANNLKVNAYLLDDEIEENIISLSDRLDSICALLGEYDELMPEIMELFDIFNEVNRLYTKDEYGVNATFTVSGELEKIERWENISEKLDRFLIKTECGGKMYLFNYFIKEAQGEATDLRSTMNSLLAQGYSPDASIRVTGAINRTFPSVKNINGASVNLQYAEIYEKYMYQGICSALAEKLGEFYVI